MARVHGLGHQSAGRLEPAFRVRPRLEPVGDPCVPPGRETDIQRFLPAQVAITSGCGKPLRAIGIELAFGPKIEPLVVVHDPYDRAARSAVEWGAEA